MKHTVFQYVAIYQTIYIALTQGNINIIMQQINKEYLCWEKLVISFYQHSRYFHFSTLLSATSYYAGRVLSGTFSKNKTVNLD